jgi:hypothetical protein
MSSLTNAEVAQRAFTDLCNFIRVRLESDEGTAAIAADLEAGGSLLKYWDYLSTATLGTLTAAARLGYLEWAYLRKKFVEPLAKAGYELDNLEESYIQEQLETLKLSLS